MIKIYLPVLLTAAVTVLTLLTLPTHSVYPPPLRQIVDSGVNPEDIQCNTGLVHAVRTNEKHVCVKQPTAKRLGWEILTESTTPYISDPATDEIRKTALQYQCDKMWAVSPKGYLGCVYEYTGILMEDHKWRALDEYSEQARQEFNFLKSADPHEDAERDDNIGRLEIALSMPNLPLVGQNATVILDINAPFDAPTDTAKFQFWLIGDVDIISSDPAIPIDEYDAHTWVGQIFNTPHIPINPGESSQITVTITPVREDNVYIHVMSIGNGWMDTSPAIEDALYLSFGNQTSGYQMNKDSYTLDPNTEYMWTERIHPQCWSTPWFNSGQTVQDYYHQLGIEVLDTKRGNPVPMTCAACECPGGSILFLTPASDYDMIPALGHVSWH